MDLVKDGTAASHIIIPNAPSAVVLYAAGELRGHIEKATGARLEIVREGSPGAPERGIFVGPCQATMAEGIAPESLRPNGFRIRTTKDAIYLCGLDGEGEPPQDDTSSMGTLFAVYRWLDEKMGVRWIWPGESGRVVPRTKNLEAGAVSDVTVDPQLISSRLRIRSKEPDDSAAHQRYLAENHAWLRRQGIARAESLEYGHAYGKYWERFGSTHPEYFALRPDGKRAPLDERTYLVQMCVSNPGLIKQIIADWQVQRKETDRTWINGIENDKRRDDPYCGCPDCLAMDANAFQKVESNPWLIGSEGGNLKKRKSLSDRYARFWLSLQKEGQKHDADVKVIGYAYADYSEAPVETKLNRNIIVGIVPDQLFPKPEDDRRFEETWAEWKDAGASLYLRPNYFLVGYCMPYIFATQFGREFKYALDHGMVATDFDSLTGMWGAQGPNLYLLGRLHARPDLSVDEVLGEFYASFGKANEEVRRYFEYWEEITKQCDARFFQETAGGWASVSKAGNTIFTKETFAEGLRILEKAKETAAGDDEVAGRIRYLEVWLEQARLAGETLTAYHAWKLNPESTSAGWEDARDRLDKYRAAHRDEFSAMNLSHLERIEKWSGWRK